MSNRSAERATSLSFQTDETNTTITGQQQVASPTSLDFHSVSLSPRDHNPNPADAMFGAPFGSTSSMNSMGTGCGCPMFSTPSGDQNSLCTIHSQISTAVPVLQNGNRTSKPAVSMTSLSLLVGGKAKVMSGTGSSEHIHDLSSIR